MWLDCRALGSPVDQSFAYGENIVRGLVPELLKRGAVRNLTGKQTEYVTHINTSGRLLLDLLEEVLDAARPRTSAGVRRN